MVRLRDAVAGKRLRQIAAASGVPHSVIRDVLLGNTWPEADTIARLEDGLDVPLWPTYQRRERDDRDDAASEVSR